MSFLVDAAEGSDEKHHQCDCADHKEWHEQRTGYSSVALEVRVWIVAIKRAAALGTAMLGPP